jgi:hypothetical protein
VSTVQEFKQIGKEKSKKKKRKQCDIKRKQVPKSRSKENKYRRADEHSRIGTDKEQAEP